MSKWFKNKTESNNAEAMKQAEESKFEQLQENANVKFWGKYKYRIDVHDGRFGGYLADSYKIENGVILFTAFIQTGLHLADSEKQERMKKDLIDGCPDRSDYVSQGDNFVSTTFTVNTNNWWKAAQNRKETDKATASQHLDLGDGTMTIKELINKLRKADPTRQVDQVFKGSCSEIIIGDLIKYLETLDQTGSIDSFHLE
jgi:hypothetical protein